METRIFNIRYASLLSLLIDLAHQTSISRGTQSGYAWIIPHAGTWTILTTIKWQLIFSVKLGKLGMADRICTGFHEVKVLRSTNSLLEMHFQVGPGRGP
ncbi:hypothetical protein HDU76_004909, partial [Blyttiomyces sp. JEL0837]